MLKELKAHHRNVLQMSFNGFKNQEIAEKLGLSEGTISGILRCPLGKSYLEGLQDRSKEDSLDVRKKLISLNRGALDTYSRILNPKTKAPFNVQFSTAKDVFDRNGYKAPDKFTIDMTLQHKSNDEIDAEIAAMEEAIEKVQGPKNPILPETKDTFPGEVDLVSKPKNSPLKINVITNSLASSIIPKTSLEDEEILEDTSFDPFNNIENS